MTERCIRWREGRRICLEWRPHRRKGRRFCHNGASTCERVRHLLKRSSSWAKGTFYSCQNGAFAGGRGAISAQRGRHGRKGRIFVLEGLLGWREGLYLLRMLSWAKRASFHVRRGLSWRKGYRICFQGRRHERKLRFFVSGRRLASGRGAMYV